MSHYESEFTVFMREMMAKHPEWAEAQRAGRALLWDKKVDFGELRRFAQVSVSPKPCQYDMEGFD